MQTLESTMENLQKQIPCSEEQALQSDQTHTSLIECKTPPPLHDKKMDPKSLNSSGDLRKTSTPDRLKVPKAFKYPERYRSPTDLMVSPITKGLLARNRKGAGALLPPSMNQSKVHDMAPDVVAFKIET